jgi:uncharacterized protein with HEPN domain
LVWSTVKNKLPEFKKQISKILEEINVNSWKLKSQIFHEVL